MNLIFAMAHTMPALSARTACTQGRDAASQSESGGQPASTHGGTEGAQIEEERRAEEGSEESEDNKDHDKDEDGSKSTSSRESKTKELAKPPAKTQVLTQPSKEDIDEGKEGTADQEEPSPCNVEAHCKACKKGDRPCKGTTNEHCMEHILSSMLRR